MAKVRDDPARLPSGVVGGRFFQPRSPLSSMYACQATGPASRGIFRVVVEFQHLIMAERERLILERAAAAVAGQAAKADALVDQAIEASGDGSHPLVVNLKMLRQELLDVKADTKRALGTWVLDCTACGQTVHWVSGLGVQPGHWAHREPAPHGQPVL